MIDPRRNHVFSKISLERAFQSPGAVTYRNASPASSNVMQMYG